MGLFFYNGWATDDSKEQCVHNCAYIKYVLPVFWEGKLDVELSKTHVLAIENETMHCLILFAIATSHS